MELVWENIVPVWALPPLLEKFRRFDSFEPTEVTSRTEVTFTLRKSETEIAFFLQVNPRTYTQSLTPTAVQGVGVDETPLEFLICCSISKLFCYKWKAFDLLQNTRYILWVVALLEVCEITKHGRHFVFYQELEIR